MQNTDILKMINKWLDLLDGTPLMKAEHWPRKLQEAERRIVRELNGAISGVDEEIIRQLRRRGLAQVIAQGATDNVLLQAGLREAFTRMTEMLMEERPEISQAARNSVISQLQQQGESVEFIDFSPQVSQRIRDEAGPIVEEIQQNLVDDFRGVIVEGYQEGKGIDEIAADIDRIEDQVKDYKTERIARTEVNGAQNEGKEQTYEDFNVDYEQWLTVDPADEDVRGQDPADEFDHVMMHGQVIRVGDDFVHPAQGWTLPYPGAKIGAPGNVINCRCTTRPYIPDPEERAAVRNAIIHQGYYYPEEEIELEFEEAETIEEASDWVEENYDILTSYADLDLDLTNEHNRSLRKFFDEFPGNEDAVSRIRSMKAKSYAGKFAPKDEDVGEPITGGDLRISKTWFQDQEHYQSLVENQTEGYSLSYEDFNEQSIMAHELGHALEYKLAVKKSGMEFGDLMTEREGHEIVSTWNHHEVADNVVHDALDNMGLPKYGQETADEMRKLGSMAVGNNAELLAQGVSNYIAAEEPTQLAKEIAKEIKRRL